MISIGTRRGAVVTRLLELAPGADGAFVNRTMAVARAAGASVALCFAIDPAIAALLQATKWKVRDNSTFSFGTAGPPLALGAGASDVGFEAIPTELV